MKSYATTDKTLGNENQNIQLTALDCMPDTCTYLSLIIGSFDEMDMTAARKALLLHDSIVLCSPQLAPKYRSAHRP